MKEQKSTKVDLKTAESEFDKWADAKKLSTRVLDKHRDDKEIIIEAIQEGRLILSEDLTFTQILQFPLREGSITELKYPVRITSGELAASTKGIRGVDDLVGQTVIGYVSALTKENKGTIRALDPVDMELGGAIAAFFSL